MKKKRNNVIWKKKRSNSGKNGMVGSSALPSSYHLLRFHSLFGTTVKLALVTTCLQQAHYLFPLKMVSHWNMY